MAVEFINEMSLKELQASGNSGAILENLKQINETNLAQAEKTDEVLATIYETILGGQA